MIEEDAVWNGPQGGCSPGRPAVGWSCSYTPEELLLAGGFSSSRLPTWQTAVQLSDSPLAATLCPYVHRIFQLGRNDGFQGYSGLVLTASCDSMRRLADACEARLRPGFVYRLDVPRRTDSAAEDFFRFRLLQLQGFLEGLTGRKITDDDLFQAIELVDTSRRLVQALSEMKARHPGLMSFQELQAICLSVQSGDKASMNRHMAERLEGLQAELQASAVPEAVGPRLLIWGCPLEDDGLASMVEGAGGQVVADDLCTGSRHFLGQVGTSGEPLRLLARRYLLRGSCSRMTGARERIQRLKDRVQATGCQGVICHTLKFCDLTQSDIPRLKRELELIGVPVLHVERQGLGDEAGQLRTRLEAFLEMLGPGGSQAEKG